MEVHKFGGASVNSTQRIKDLLDLVRVTAHQKKLIVISAMGKTTNDLEQVAQAFYAGNTHEALQLFDTVKTQHVQIFTELTGTAPTTLQDFFTEAEWLLHDKPVRSYDYYYDQIVCIGELLSTALISAYFTQQGLQNAWVDVRDILRTDDNFREAAVDFEFAATATKDIITPLFATNTIVITQGFIGATADNESTTLGREGSDYTAAIFANLLNATSQTIWKDVAGVMTGDPKTYEQASVINHLNYNEVIEMAYYGAQVIHPKTIKPLQNKNIPLHVKCFLNANLLGTTIDNGSIKNLPPIVITKNNQVLLTLKSKDFSFVDEAYISQFYQLLAQQKVKPNLIQTTAISILCCLDNTDKKIEAIALAAADYFDVQVVKQLTLFTVRHYSSRELAAIQALPNLVLQQTTPETVQVLYCPA
jgi:aspartate kinase